MEDKLEKSAELLRHQLGSIDMSDILKIMMEELTPEEADNASHDISLFYEGYFKKKLKRLIQSQLEFMGTQINDQYDVQFSRGTINGLTLVKDWLDEQVLISESKRTQSDTRQEGESIKSVGGHFEV